MKIIDERGRLFGKVSVLDLLVLIVVALLLYAAHTKFNVIQLTSPSVETKPVQYTLLARNYRDTNANLIRAGDKVWTETGTNVGTVTEVRIVPATQQSRLLDGTIVTAGIESKYDIYITIEAQSTGANGRRYVERTFELALGRDDRFLSKYQAWIATIVEINVEDGAA